MSKKKARAKTDRVIARRRSRNKFFGGAIAILALTVCCAGIVGSWSARVNNNNSPHPLFASAPSPSPLPLAKEYIYGGSKLIATEEPNMPPTVSITNPGSNAVFTAPANITIEATASDADGSISKVEFYQSTTLLGTDTTAPFSFTWPTVGAGTYSLTAKATDNNNAVTTSSAVSVVLNATPAVSITSPANNATFTAPANVTINATANDADGTVSKVDFYQGTTLLGTDTTAPFSFTWPAVAAGTYSLTAKATDNNNAVTTSSAVSVVSNAAPAVSITSPANNATFTAPANVTINATASDADGTVSKVDFYQGTTLLGTDTTTPFSFAWPAVAAGTYSLTARATDNNNAVTTSSAIAINVGSNAAPTVSITSPANNAVFAAPASITINATASDADGSISKVDFYQGTTLLGTDTTAPFSFTWNNVVSGTYSITAKATDNNNAVTTSSAVSVVSNTAPTVSISSPANNAIFTAPANITINATVSDADGSISKVDFYQGTTLLGTDTTAPFSFTWSNITSGTYSLTAKATDNNNAVTTSSAVAVISNTAPTVSISSPANNAMFAAPANITINASAGDADGTISSVEFYSGTTLLGTDTTAPFSFTWNTVASGSYLLTAKATDNRGAFTTSAVLPVTTPTFYDDFNDNSLDLGKWHLRVPGSPATVSEQNQQLRITLPPNTATYNGVGSNAYYDMRGGTAQVEMVQSVSQAGWVENYLLLEMDGQNYLFIQTGVGNLILQSTVNGVVDRLITPYDPAAHRHWRIRHNLTTNTVSFETSPDGAIWTSRKTVAAGFSLTAIRLVLLAGAWGTGSATPGAAIYNDFQYIPDPSVPGTPAAILSDDFNDNFVDTSKWNPDNLFSGFTNLNVPLSETAQRLEIGPLLQNVNGSSYRGVRSVNAYNFTGAYSYVELVQAPSAATSADAMFTIGKDVEYYYRIYVNAGNLIGLRRIAGVKTTLFTIPYDPVNHRFLRIRHDSATGAVTLDTATGNGGVPGTWVQRYSESWNTSVTLGAIIFEVKGGTWQIEANPPGKVIFDNFRVAVNGS
jgi:Big-like domain-containing protein